LLGDMCTIGTEKGIYTYIVDIQNDADTCGKIDRFFFEASLELNVQPGITV
jgi:hypothetical protein